ncbi:MAG: hypothetical protein LBS54_04110 [Dysgonamonadaceae bacterium]|jgi:hypothetical protein|nr:hypothetical protein [Dysgonamonadaceae bacterium]
MTVKGLKDKIEAFNKALKPAINEEVHRTRDVILSLNQDQLLYGRNADGELLKPDYMDDPYFEGDKEKALNYLNGKINLEDMHESLIRFPELNLFTGKPRGTPNLIINGAWFMNHLFINVGEGTYTIGSYGIKEGDISKKYNNRTYGLAPPSRRHYYFEYLRPVIEQLWKNTR